MHALFIVLNKTDYLDLILSKLIELGIDGATIIDSQGMASAIVNESMEGIPMFGALKSLIGNDNPYSKTVFTVIKSHMLLSTAMEQIAELMMSVKNRPVGFMFTVPVEDVVRLGQ